MAANTGDSIFGDPGTEVEFDRYNGGTLGLDFNVSTAAGKVNRRGDAAFKPLFEKTTQFSDDEDDDQSPVFQAFHDQKTKEFVSISELAPSEETNMQLRNKLMYQAQEAKKNKLTALGITGGDMFRRTQSAPDAQSPLSTSQSSLARNQVPAKANTFRRSHTTTEAPQLDKDQLRPSRKGNRKSLARRETIGVFDGKKSAHDRFYEMSMPWLNGLGSPKERKQTPRSDSDNKSSDGHSEDSPVAAFARTKSAPSPQREERKVEENVIGRTRWDRALFGVADTSHLSIRG
jgi:hypothetical protein